MCLLLEKEPTVAAVTTPQAAGLVGQVRNTVERTKLAMWSVKTFSQLERGDHPKPGWRQVGSLRIALCDERVAEFHRMKAVADEAGLEAEFIDAKAASEKWPAMDFQRAKAILWCPSDGYLQPSDLTMSYVAHARSMGVRFQTNSAVRRIVLQNDRVTGVETEGGVISCQMVINAAGAHAYHIARGVGLELPIVPVRHEYFVTVQADGLEPNLARRANSRYDALPSRGNQFAALRRLGTGRNVCRSARVLSRRHAAAHRQRLGRFGLVRPATCPRNAGRRTNGNPQRLQRLADVYARRPLHRRRKLAREGLRNGRRLQCPRRVWLGRHRPACRRVGSRTRPFTVREKPEPRPIRSNLGLAFCSA